MLKNSSYYHWFLIIELYYKGDGLEWQREQNITLYNITYSNDELKGDVTQNPNLWIYQLVYGLSFVFLIATGIVKGIGVTFRYYKHSVIFDLLDLPGWNIFLIYCHKLWAWFYLLRY